jgi:hypothetical protein
MPVDASWLWLTAVYCTVAVLGMLAIVLSIMLLVKKVKRVTAGVNQRTRMLAGQQRRTAQETQAAGRDIADAGKRVGKSLRERMTRLAVMVKGK